jgi:hypothetical protein
MGRPTPEEIKDLRDAPKLEDAYTKASTNTPPAPAPKTEKKAKGGTASSRADGIAQRGKTKGTLVMCGGGMYKK